jgi:RHS repeat-associated protein
VRQGFTAYEEDSETGLDYAQARYYANGQGRFTSPDPLLSSAIPIEPDSWNRYTYVSNNPLKFIDPSGLYEWNASLGGGLTDDQLRDLRDRAKSFGVDPKVYQSVLDRREAFKNALATADRASNSSELSAAEQTQVRESVAAYGSEGSANGVSVGVGYLAKGVAAEATLNATPFPYDQNTNSVRASITVTIDDDTTGDNLTIAVAHEGRHVADAQAFATALTADIASGGANAVAGSFNRTRYERETRGYSVSSYVAQALGLPNSNYGGNEIWNNSWAAADRATKRAAGIQKHLKESKSYKLTPTNPGNKYQ